MKSQEARNLISEQLIQIAEDIRNLEDQPYAYKTDKLIYQLYQVMRQLSDLSEIGSI